MGGKLHGGKVRFARATDPGDVTAVRGSGNVFADLGLANPEERQVKADLAREIAALVKGRKQIEIAQMLGVDQPKVSALLRGRLKDFSTERLMDFLVILGQTVEIHVKPARRAAGKPAQGHLVVV